MVTLPSEYRGQVENTFYTQNTYILGHLTDFSEEKFLARPLLCGTLPRIKEGGAGRGGGGGRGPRSAGTN